MCLIGAFLISQELCVPGWGVGIDCVVVLTRAMSSASYVVEGGSATTCSEMGWLVLKYLLVM